MSAETLRGAARLMRERAEGATPGPWVSRPAGKMYGPDGQATGRDIIGDLTDPVCPKHVTHVAPWGGVADAAHIASWHPAVALAVADWLDRIAVRVEEFKGFVPASQHLDMVLDSQVLGYPEALAVARAYLGHPAPTDAAP